MFYILLIIALLAFVIFLVKTFRKYNKEFAEKRSEFVAYLDEIGDIETLKAIGEINWFGQREQVFPRYSQIVNYIEEKYAKTKDEKFKKFLEDYRVHVGNFSIVMPMIIISILVIIHSVGKLISGL